MGWMDKEGNSGNIDNRKDLGRGSVPCLIVEKETLGAGGAS